MTAAVWKGSVSLQLPGGDRLLLRRAQVSDLRRIQMLYAEVYGPNYPMAIISDAALLRAAVTSREYFWLVADRQGRIMASLIYELDPGQRLAKAFGAVVSKEYRKQNLAVTMMEMIHRRLTGRGGPVDAVYATTRTVTLAPQHLTENLGFAKLGIFPNAHKVFEHETHCLAAYFVPGALRRRRTPPELLEELEPFYRLVQRQLKLGKAVFRRRADQAELRQPAPPQPLLRFEEITAPEFIRRRFARTRNTGLFANAWVPFHRPNLLLLTPDQSTEVFLCHGKQDQYGVILGGRTRVAEAALVLNSVAQRLAEMGVRYIEFIADAYSPGLQEQALHARFLPSAYFPAYRKVGVRRWDYIVFSRSFEMLDFRNVHLTSDYRAFLKEYMKLWQSLYLDAAFRG